MANLNLEQLFKRVTELLPNISREEFWDELVEEKDDLLIILVDVIKGASFNVDFSIRDEDLVWQLSAVVRCLISQVYGKFSIDLDHSIFEITKTEVLKDKDTAFWAYFVGVFRDEHKSAIIENIIRAKHDEYTIDEYRSMSCFEVDEKNYWEFIQLLYDFRESPNLTKYEDEFEMAAMYIEAEEEGNQDVRYQTLIKKFWKGTVFYI